MNIHPQQDLSYGPKRPNGAVKLEKQHHAWDIQGKARMVHVWLKMLRGTLIKKIKSQWLSQS